MLEAIMAMVIYVVVIEKKYRKWGKTKNGRRKYYLPSDFIYLRTAYDYHWDCTHDSAVVMSAEVVGGLILMIWYHNYLDKKYVRK